MHSRGVFLAAAVFKPQRLVQGKASSSVLRLDIQLTDLCLQFMISQLYFSLSGHTELIASSTQLLHWLSALHLYVKNSQDTITETRAICHLKSLSPYFLLYKLACFKVTAVKTFPSLLWTSLTNSIKFSYTNSIWPFFAVCLEFNRVYKIGCLRNRKDSFGVWIFLKEFSTFSESGPSAVRYSEAYGNSALSGTWMVTFSVCHGCIMVLRVPKNSSLVFSNMVDPRFYHLLW